MIQFEVWESCLHDQEGGTRITAFDTQEEAAAYVRENEDYSFEAGHALFIIPASDK